MLVQVTSLVCLFLRCTVGWKYFVDVVVFCLKTVETYICIFYQEQVLPCKTESLLM